MIRIALALLVAAAAHGEFRLATFKADVTAPIGHPLMGGGIAPATEILTPLYITGLVLLGGEEKPVVIASVDWCEIRNDAYDAYRDALAEAAGTDRERVLLSAIHQHDAPIADFRAQAILDEAGLPNALCDVAYVKDAIAKSAAALRDSLPKAVPVDAYGIGEAEVFELASSRRVIGPDGVPNYNRTSATADPDMRAQPAGQIDPMLKTLSFWHGETPVAALHAYSVHPMSFYGKGGVNYDFPGIARERRQTENPAVFQLYVSGASGDTIAGKWNDGAPENRAILADKLHDAMTRAWDATTRHPLERLRFVNVPFHLSPRDDGDFAIDAMRRTLANDSAAIFFRNLAAMGLSYHERFAAGRPIDMPLIDLGAALYIVQPAEAFVEYQLYAQRVRPDAMVFTAGYGESAPGYIPSRLAIEEDFIAHHSWCWVAPTAPESMTAAIQAALRPEVPVAALPESDGAFDIPADEWPFQPGPRKVKVYLRYPGGQRINIGRDTGLMLSLHNWGGTHAIGAPDPVILSDRYNLVVVSVDYLQSGKWDAEGPHPYDHGYLQALDALRAFHAVYDGLIRLDIPFDGARMYAAGGSGGGNVSLMANKLAPRTFAAVVDLSGMAELNDDIAYGREGGSKLDANWSDDPNHPNYLDPAAQALRRIGEPEHLAVMKALGNQARIVVIHGTEDAVCPVAGKRAMVANMEIAGLHVEAHWIDPAMIDGVLIKDAGHSLGDRTELLHRFAGPYLDPKSEKHARRTGPNDFDLRDARVQYPLPGAPITIGYEPGHPLARLERGNGM